MTTALIIALLFLCGTAYNLIAADGTLANAAATAAISATFVATHFFTLKQEEALERFAQWLVQNAEQVQSSGEYYGNTLITNETRLTQYFLTVSIFIVSLRIPTRLFIVGKERSLGAVLACTLLTLVLGWWAFPWGPVRTIQSLYYNLTGGKETSIAALLTRERSREVARA
jgi:hypothetical protein